jgi:Domain of unknown function (DUF4105)
MHLRIKKFIITCLIVSILPLMVHARTDSSGLRISLLTCSPGDELYSTFGHSALRIVDSAAGTDIVYNFGVFDFQDPDFYLKFVQGKLLYYLDQQAFQDFTYAYDYEGRQVSEQVLDIPGNRKKALQQYLFMTVRPENRFYKYDFLFNNCTTRLRDLIFNALPQERKVVCVARPAEQTFRKHIHQYLDANGKDWAKLGIDILLGRRLDRIMNDQDAMFLPDYLEIGLDGSNINGKPIVAEKKVLLPRRTKPLPNSGIPLSFTVLGLLAGLVTFFSFQPRPIFERITRTADFILFLATGLLGILLVLMWTATDHQICRDNMNLLWALPTNLPAAFFIGSGQAWTKKYFRGIAWLSAILILGWPVLSQSLNISLIPVVIWLGLSALRISRKTA